MLTPTGIPRAGLVAWHDLYFPNLAYHTETPASWVGYKNGTGTDAVITGGQTDPDGGSTAVRLQMDAGAGTEASDVCYVAISTPSVRGGPETCTFGFWARANNSVETELRCQVGGQTLLLSPNLPSSGEWVFVSKSLVPSAPSYLAIKVWGVSGSKSADVTVWHPQFYPCASAATLPAYSATGALQTAESGLLDLSGNGNHLSRGLNTSGADSNDPTVLGPGLGFVTDDYASAPQTASDYTGPLTVLAVGKSNVNTSAMYWLAKYPGSGGSNSFGLYQYASDTNLYMFVTRGNGTTTRRHYAPSRKFAPGTVQCVGVVCPTGTIEGVPTLYQGGVGSVMAAFPGDTATGAVASDASPLSIGHNGGGVNYWDGTMYEVLVWRRALSAGEFQRSYRAVKAKWAARGVSIV